MQAVSTQPATPSPEPYRHWRYFALPPVTAIGLITLLLAIIFTSYQAQHRDHIFTGVNVWGVDLSQMSREEAQAALGEAFPYFQQKAITFIDPSSGQQWPMSPTELGLVFDAETTVRAAYDTGRTGSLLARFQEIFVSWYYGRSLSPILVLDEGQLDIAISKIAAEINRAAVGSKLTYEGQTVTYTPGQKGISLDIAEIRNRLLSPLTSFRQAQIELLVHDTTPPIYEDTDAANRIQQFISAEPITFYLQEPLDGVDLNPVTLPPAELARWLRVDIVEQAGASRQHQVYLDENAARQWLSQFTDLIYRESVNARYYFDDVTRELIVVSPHISGRELDVDTTLARLIQQAGTPNRNIPFALKEITPPISSSATAEELGITELISERTTWFYGSSDARKRNISRAAANFYGIVIAPGEEFSFNRYLGTITEDDGYEEGLIIVGGQTIKGIGGGVCQVSTTVYQTVFFAGFPVSERWQHGYMLGYYNDGEGPGMDATVYSPIVDFKFINNTPYHLLIENYYNATEESLTFKFYSTSLGRRVEKSGPVFENIISAPLPEEDVWQFDEEMEPGTVRQIDWATEGARVTVGRTIFNAAGEVILQEDIVSDYIPWPNGFMYGSGVDAPDYSLVPLEE